MEQPKLVAVCAGLVLVLVVACASSLSAAEDDRRLVEAAKAGDWATVHSLVDAGSDANTPQADGASALHWAAFWNEFHALDRLLEAGASVDAANDYGATPLWVACANRHPKVVLRLLAAGASPNLGLHSGESVLMRCAYTGAAEAVAALLERRAAVNYREPSRGQTALMWAASRAHPDATRLLLEHGAEATTRTAEVEEFHGTAMLSITSPAGAQFFRTGGVTPLHVAARGGDHASAELLLDAGADLHQTAGDGNTALVVAIMSSHGRLAKFLLERGADPNAAEAGYSPLHAAILRSDPQLVKSLLARGADLEARLVQGSPVRRYTYDYVFTHKEKGATPLMLAAKYLEPELVEILAAAGADPSAVLENDTTALMLATGLSLSRGSTRRSQLLIPEIVAARWADEERVLNTVLPLLEAGADATITLFNRAGDTALHGAARHRFLIVIDLLVAQGASLDFENKEGTSPRALLER